MVVTPYHLILNYVVYFIFVKIKIIKKGDYFPLWMMFASNLVDLDHFLRLFSGESPIKQDYGLDNLFLHGWWCVLPISGLMFFKKYKWFAFGWALHIILDGIMVVFGFDALFMKR